MAACTVSKCSRCIAQFGSSALSVKQNRLLLRNILQPGVCVARRFAFKSFPWIQSSTDIYPKDPIHHRISSSLMFTNLMKQVPGGLTSAREYQKAFKDCTLLVSDLIGQMDPNNKLNGLLGSRLDRLLKQSFTALAEHKFNLHLEVSDVSNLHCIGIRMLSGPLEPNSECSVTKLFGYWLYLEASEVEGLAKAFYLSPSSFRKFTTSLLNKKLVSGLRFQMVIKFRAKETFFITGQDGEILNGSKNSVSSYHMWVFESIFDWVRFDKQEYPLSWKAVDIDNYVHFRSPKHKPLFKHLLSELSKIK